jgi:hypothetical protein
MGTQNLQTGKNDKTIDQMMWWRVTLSENSLKYGGQGCLVKEWTIDLENQTAEWHNMQNIMCTILGSIWG